MSNLVDKVVKAVEGVGKEKNQRGANRRESHPISFKAKVLNETDVHR